MIQVDSDIQVETGFLIAPGLTLPSDADARRIAFVGMSGSGKTSSAKVLVEHLARAGRRITIIDPAGVWSGLRVGSDGVSPGLPFVVFGGHNADVPLEVDAGAAVADLVMQDNLAVILDLSGFEDDASMCRVSADFIRRLRFLQNPEHEPLLLVVDEADLIAPQTARKEQMDSQRALINVARRSRSDGLGLLVITQRPAAITKDVLTQAEAVFLLRFAGYTDLMAVEDWIGAYLTKSERQAVISALPSLPEGEAFVTSPSWMRTFTRVQFPMPTTFDSSATPKAGGARRTLQARADVDLSALAQRFTAAIEAERENDPEELKKRITSLQGQLREAKPEPIETVVERIVEVEKVVEKVVEVEKIVEVPALAAGQVEELRAIADTLASGGKDMLGMAQEILARVSQVSSHEPTKSTQVPSPPIVGVSAGQHPQNEASDPHIQVETADFSPKSAQNTQKSPAPNSAGTLPAGITLTRPQQTILNTLADLAQIGMTRPLRDHVALFADMSPKSSGYGINLKALRDARMVDYPAASQLALTDTGKAAAKPSVRPLSRRALQDAWLRRLKAPQANLLRHLIACYPRAMTRDVLAHYAGISASSSGYGINLKALKDLGLVEYPRPAEVGATKLLFPSGLPE